MLGNQERETLHLVKAVGVRAKLWCVFRCACVSVCVCVWVCLCVSLNISLYVNDSGVVGAEVVCMP